MAIFEHGSVKFEYDSDIVDRFCKDMDLSMRLYDQGYLTTSVEIHEN